MKSTASRLLAVGFAVALALAVAAAAAAAGRTSEASHKKLTHFSHTATLIVRSDDEHAKKGPDGKWHDAFLPANFSITAGVPVKVTVLNYDNSPHSFSSPDLRVSAIVKGAKGKTPGKITFTLKVKKPGEYLWWCSLPCDSYAMSHVGFMRGYVKVVA